MTRVFIDGSAGTTGLRIRARLQQRDDLELMVLPDELRKDVAARARALNEADVAFLCLPDAAAVEAAALVEDSHTVIIDTSTAHRCSAGWTYGFPELAGTAAIAAAKRIANPGCHATGFIALVAPLVRAGLISPDAPLSCFSLTGYTGGGKSMIASYEQLQRPRALEAPRLYGLSQQHKHLPEMVQQCGLGAAPVFCPIVAPYAEGMQVMVPLPVDAALEAQDVCAAYQGFYHSPLVAVAPCEAVADNGFLAANDFAGFDDLRITVCGTPGRLVAVACFDNLGKGASGAAIQNMNLVLGCEMTKGLNIHG